MKKIQFITIEIKRNDLKKENYNNRKLINVEENPDITLESEFYEQITKLIYAIIKNQVYNLCDDKKTNTKTNITTEKVDDIKIPISKPFNYSDIKFNLNGQSCVQFGNGFYSLLKKGGC